MNASIFTSLEAPPFCAAEALRYAGCRTAQDEVSRLLCECLSEAQGGLSYRVCYRKLQLRIDGNVCDFGVFSVRSERLAANLAGCRECLIFAATIGVEIDRMIAKYGRIAPARALLLQGIGAERVEALCDEFLRGYAREQGVGLRPRFSPGYGDVSIEVQKDVFSVLDCARKIGLSLNDSMLLSPSKSVTAFAGISGRPEEERRNGCALCEKTDCVFRSVL